MRLSELKTIQELPKIKRFKPIPKPTLEEWETGDIMNAIQICLLISHVGYNAMMIIEDGKEWTGAKALLIDSHFLIVKRLFERIDEGYIMQKEFNQIKRDFNIRFDED